jgi:hypothetical protein
MMRRPESEVKVRAAFQVRMRSVRTGLRSHPPRITMPGKCNKRAERNERLVVRTKNRRQKEMSDADWDPASG